MFSYPKPRGLNPRYQTESWCPVLQSISDRQQHQGPTIILLIWMVSWPGPLAGRPDKDTITYSGSNSSLPIKSNSFPTCTKRYNNVHLTSITSIYNVRWSLKQRCVPAGLQQTEIKTFQFTDNTGEAHHKYYSKISSWLKGKPISTQADGINIKTNSAILTFKSNRTLDKT